MSEENEQPEEDAAVEEATPPEAPDTEDAPAAEEVGAAATEGGAPAEADAAPDAEPAVETEQADEAEELPALDDEAEEPPALEAEPAAESPADDAPKAAASAPPAKDKPAKSEDEDNDKDVVPGADLDPIAITEERELSAEERAALEAEEEERAAAEAAAAAEEDEEDVPVRKAAAVPKDTSIQATGKRKSSVARILLRAGEGKLEINGRELDDYFPRPMHRTMARQPLVTCGYDANVDIRIRVHGGGIAGQAGAIRHGISRALVDLDPELRGELKKRGLLTRDAREKERRKAGFKKARKKPQFSKR